MFAFVKQLVKIIFWNGKRYILSYMQSLKIDAVSHLKSYKHNFTKDFIDA